MLKKYFNEIIITYSIRYLSAAFIIFATSTFVTAFVSVTSANSKEQAVIEITSSQAFDLWKKNRDKVKIVDCRTKDEFDAAHPEMALNIPVEFKVDGSVIQNPDFESEVQKVADKSDTVLMICRTGRRSYIAALRMLDAGFQDVRNIADGFDGNSKKNLEDGSGAKGWKNSNLPWKNNFQIQDSKK